jgi:hypothetical protein
MPVSFAEPSNESAFVRTRWQGDDSRLKPLSCPERERGAWRVAPESRGPSSKKNTRTRSVSWNRYGPGAFTRYEIARADRSAPGFIDIAKKTGRGLAASAAILAVVSLTAAPSTAYARDWHGGGGHWGGGHWGGYRHHGGGGAGIALGILGGALAAGAIASAPYYGYGYSYPYYYGSYPYGSYYPY